MNTLSIFTGGIGDCLLVGPAFAHLREQGPLDLAGNPERLALIQAAGACDAIHNLDRIEFHTAFDKPSPKLRDFVHEYDCVIVWMRDDGEIKKAIQNCGVSNVQVFPGLPPEHWQSHATDYYTSCVDPARREPRPPLRIANWEDETPAESHDVIIHPGSGSPNKNWPIENFVTVANHLEKTGRHVAWIQGPAETALEYPTNAAIIEADSLMAIAQQLAKANLYIGNDSGITHLAAATGCATVAIFGPTDPAIWAPRGDHVCVATNYPWPTQEVIMEVLVSLDNTDLFQ